MDTYDHILIDGNNLAYRIFATHKELSVSVPPETLWTGLTHGFMSFLCKLKRRYEGRICLCWDGGNHRRKALFPQYKANRKKDWDEKELFDKHLKELKPALRMCGVRQYRKQFEECDDVIFTLVKRKENFYWRASILIVSNDHDFYRLITEDVHQLISKDIILDPISLKAKVGATAEEYGEAMCIAGDPTDGIPGIKGVGIKRALKAIREGTDLSEHQETIDLTKALVELYDVWPLTVSKSEFKPDALNNFLELLQLFTLQERFSTLERLSE